MSLLLVTSTERFAIVACDGTSSQRNDDGSLIRVRDDYQKFAVLTPSIVLGCTGSAFIFEGLKSALQPLATQYKNIPELFEALTIAVPFYARALLADGNSIFDQPLEAALTLVGYDAAQKTIRNVVWRSDKDFATEDYPTNGFMCFGNEDANPLANSMMADSVQACPSPGIADLLPAAERVIMAVAEKVPRSVNKNIRSCVVTVPTSDKPRDNILDGITFSRGTFGERAGGAIAWFPTASLNASGGYVDVTNSITAPAPLSSFVQTTTSFSGAVQLDVDVWSTGSGNIIDFLLYSGTSGASGPNGYMFRFDSRIAQFPGVPLVINNGTWSLIGTAKTSANAANLAAGWHHLTAVSYGDGHFDVWVDGVWSVTAFDTTFTPGGGIFGYAQELANGRIRHVKFSHPLNGGNSASVLLNNKLNASGSTSSPTTTSSTYSTIPEMTQTITTKGNKILIAFSGAFFITGSTSNPFLALAVFRDGVKISQDYIVDILTSQQGLDQLGSITFIDSPSAGSHTYDIRWSVFGSAGTTLTNDTVTRAMQIVELG